MAQLLKLPRPVVARPAGFDANETRIKLFEELQKLSAPERSIEHHSSIFCDPVHLKDVLGQILADCCNLHWMAPFLAADSNCTMAHCDADEAEAIYPIRNAVIQRH